MGRLLTAIGVVWVSCSVALAAEPIEPTGRPPGVAPLASQNTRGFPAPNLTPGQPIETRPPELATDKPAFPGQTRAPYRPTVPYQVITLTDKLEKPWSLAFLPNGKMLVTEKPGRLRVVDSTGALSEPISGLPPIKISARWGCWILRSIRISALTIGSSFPSASRSGRMIATSPSPARSSMSKRCSYRMSLSSSVPSPRCPNKRSPRTRGPYRHRQRRNYVRDHRRSVEITAVEGCAAARRAPRKDNSYYAGWCTGARQSVLGAGRCSPGNLDAWSPKPGRASVRSFGPALGKRAWSARRRQIESDRARQKLRLAIDQSRA